MANPYPFLENSGTAIEVPARNPAATPKTDKRTARTREAIVHHTEALIASHGISAVSARMIARVCHLRNNVSVQYHFGSMEELYKAIMDLRMSQLSDLRAEMVAREEPPAEADARIDYAVKVICLPHLHIAGDDMTFPYAAFLCEYLPRYYPSGLPWVMGDSTQGLTVIGRMLGMIHEALPGVPAELVDRRITNATLLFLNVLRSLALAGESRMPHAEAVIEDAFRQAAAAIRA